MANLETHRLLLREWRDADLEAWGAMNADPRVMEFFPSAYDRERSARTAAVLRAELRRTGFGSWAVEVKGVLPFAGVVALQMVPSGMPFAPALEIGWRLARDAWGHGYATEGARAALALAFDGLGRDEVVAFTAATNLRSRRVMDKLGMTRDPADDFEHPKLPPKHGLRKHVLYRLRRDAFLKARTSATIANVPDRDALAFRARTAT